MSIEVPADLQPLIDDLIDREGGYVNSPSDHGGPTKFGITESVARGYGYKGDMKDLPRPLACEIYYVGYWIGAGLNKIYPISKSIALKLFDVGVNCGKEFAGKTIQRCLNVLNNDAKLYPNLLVDGRIGNVTAGALEGFIILRKTDGSRTLQFMIAAQQSNYYLELAEAAPSQEAHEYGWQSQRALYEAIP